MTGQFGMVIDTNKRGAMLAQGAGGVIIPTPASAMILAEVEDVDLNPGVPATKAIWTATGKALVTHLVFVPTTVTSVTSDFDWSLGIGGSFDDIIASNRIRPAAWEAGHAESEPVSAKNRQTATLDVVTLSILTSSIATALVADILLVGYLRLNP